MNGNAAPKTQKRIDAMKNASGAVKKIEEEIKQREAKLREDKINARFAKEMEQYEKSMEQSRKVYLDKVNEQIRTEKNFSLMAAKGAKDGLDELERLMKNYGPLSDKEIVKTKQSMAAVAYNDILQNEASKREIAREIQGSPEIYKSALEKTLNSPVMQYITGNLSRESLRNFISDPKRTIDNAIRATAVVNENKPELRQPKRQPELGEEKKPEMKAGK